MSIKNANSYIIKLAKNPNLKNVEIVPAKIAYTVEEA